MKIKRWLIVIGMCVTVFAGLAAFKFFQIKSAIEFAASFPEPSETVEVEHVTLVPFQAEVNVIGEVVAARRLDLRNELAGRVVAVNFSSGDSVRKGQVLIQQDISEESARLNAAKANAELASQSLKRTKKLRLENTVSVESFDRAKAQFDTANAEIETLQAIIAKKTLRAPFDAITGIHEFELGQYLQSNTLITSLVGLNDFVWVDFSLPHTYGELQVGAAVSVRISQHQRDAEGITSLPGEVVAMDSIVSADSRNQRYRARVSVVGQSLRPNAIVNVTVPVGAMEQVTAVANTSVKYDHFGQYVFVLEKDDQGNYRAQRRPIELGPEFGALVIVKSGLEEGELLAANGAFKLRQGLLVYIRERGADISLNATVGG